MWKWIEFLPIADPVNIVTAHEGGTPLYRAERLGGGMGLMNLYLKDETKNPTGTFKDRGASSTISKLKELEVGKIAVASEGNAACSFALYSKLAGIECHAYTPKSVSPSKRMLLEALGAHLTLVEGTIMDAGVKAKEDIEEKGLYNCATFVTPYRHDGKGTMAFEICEELGWRSPEAVIYPTGGGVGLVGMWKAFKAMKDMDWIQSLPRMFAVQPLGCAPIVEAYHRGLRDVEEWMNPHTIASGLQVPKPLAGSLILDVVRDSRGEAVAVGEDEIRRYMDILLRREGLLLEPSSATAFAALSKLIEDKVIDPDETVVVIVTGSGLKTLEEFI
jgi:threonine synthase